METGTTSAIDVAATTAHICRRIRETPVTREPWPHLVVDEILPPAAFEQLLAAIPEVWLRMPATQPRNWVTVDPNRAAALLHDDATNAQHWPRSDLLLSIFNALKQGGMLYAVVSEKLGAEIKASMRAVMKEYGAKGLNVRQNSRLMRDAAAYDLRPHTDEQAKLISVIVYVRSDPGRRLGTILYEPVERGFTDPKAGYHDPADFRAAAEVPFKPNSALIFARRDHTFHGVAFMPEDPQSFARVTLQSNLFMSLIR